jgi:WD40 repeat protein
MTAATDIAVLPQNNITMASSTTPTPPLIPLAPQSAHTSLKRARLLFDCGSGVGASSNVNSNSSASKTKGGGSGGGDSETATTTEGILAATHAFVPPLYDRNSSLHKLNIERKIRLLYPGEIDKLAWSGDATMDDYDGEKKSASSASSATVRAVRELKQEALEKLRSGGGAEFSSSAGPTGKIAGNEDRLVLHREQDLLKNNASNTTTSNSSSMVLFSSGTNGGSNETSATPNKLGGGILVNRTGSSTFETSIPTPTWHAPWKLSTVLSSHLGWVRSVAFDPTNTYFATGGADRVIKLFDLAKACTASPDALMITLTGHISPVRGLAFSERHPYLFSAGEDKLIKCWDLETNQVIRHYHGHLSGVFALKLHPTLDILVTGGRDAVARVWDMRSKHQIHCLSGHDNTVGAILTKGTDPQVSDE